MGRVSIAGGSLAGLVGAGLAALAGARLTQGAVTSTVDPAAEERKRVREAAKVEKTRLERLFEPARYRPNTRATTLGWNRVAWVYPQKREAARRVRQQESRFQKALNRLPPVESAAEFG